jgi:hypothetical protein
MNFLKHFYRDGTSARRMNANWPRFGRFLTALRICVTVLLPAEAGFSQDLSPLAQAPDWTRLEIFQETITHDDFVKLLDEVYAPAGVWQATIKINDGCALIAEDAPWSRMFTLRFSKDGAKQAPPHYWKPPAKLPPFKENKPLNGLKIALDPGHLGGRWARMEERWFVIGDSKPVAEGDMTLLTAKILAKKLRALGAGVSFVRSTPGPTTEVRPRQLLKAALAELKRQQLRFIRENYTDPADPIRQNSIQWESELLFYRISEIHARGRIVNNELRPDLTLCLHYNAEAWGDEKNPTLSEKNHLHLLINGSYTASELALDDERFEMLLKLLTRCFPEELAISKTVAVTMAAETGLPPYAYEPPHTATHPVPGEPYLWLRNLLANRLYRNPTIYVEPYVMNSQLVFDRVQAGDYEGERDIDGAMRKSIYREYADAVADGLAAYYRGARMLPTHVPK